MKNGLSLNLLYKITMNKLFKHGFIFSILVLALCVVSSCKNDDPSIIKVFVRSATNELLNGAQVVIIGDVNSNPPTNAYVDTAITNSSGFATIDLVNYFSGTSKDAAAYFDVLVTKDGKDGAAYVRCKAHITSVETVFLSN
jgi:hypothetical protein